MCTRVLFQMKQRFTPQISCRSSVSAFKCTLRFPLPLTFLTEFFFFPCFFPGVRALFVSLSEKLLGLPFGGRGCFGVGGQDAHYVLESFADLSSESVRVLEYGN